MSNDCLTVYQTEVETSIDHTFHSWGKNTLKLWIIIYLFLYGLSRTGTCSSSIAPRAHYTWLNDVYSYSEQKHASGASFIVDGAKGVILSTPRI